MFCGCLRIHALWKALCSQGNSKLYRRKLSTAWKVFRWSSVYLKEDTLVNTYEFFRGLRIQKRQLEDVSNRLDRP